MTGINLRFRFKCALRAFINPTINNYTLKGEFPFTPENDSQPIKLTSSLGAEAGDSVTIGNRLFRITDTAIYVELHGYD